MLSLGTEARFAFWMASKRVGLPAGSPPPMRAATSMSFTILAKSLLRFASLAAFLCLVVAHFECPAMSSSPSYARGQRARSWRADGSTARFYLVLFLVVDVAEVNRGSAPPLEQVVGDLGQPLRVYLLLQREQVGKGPPSQFVDHFPLPRGPAGRVEINPLGQVQEKELFVLADRFGGEVEDRRPREDGAHERGRFHPNPGFLLQLPHRGVAGTLPRLTAASDREPPMTRWVIQVMPAGEEEPVIDVEDQHPGGVAVAEAIRAGLPVCAEEGHTALALGPAAERNCSRSACTRPRSRCSAWTRRGISASFLRTACAIRCRLSANWVASVWNRAIALLARTP